MMNDKVFIFRTFDGNEVITEINNDKTEWMWPMVIQMTIGPDGKGRPVLFPYLLFSNDDTVTIKESAIVCSYEPALPMKMLYSEKVMDYRAQRSGITMASH
jgi:hypothetical protein